MSFKIVKDFLIDYLAIALGTLIMALALVLFLSPSKIVFGGVGGIAIVIKQLWDFPLGITMILLNVPLFLIGLKLLGKSFGARTFYAFTLFAFFTDILDRGLELVPATDNILLASIFGGITLGLGLGIVFRFQGTTGGSDIVGQIIDKYTNLSIGTGIILTDFLIIISAGIIFGNINLALYGLISLYLSGQIIDMVINGLDYARSFYIITDQEEDIKQMVLDKMERGGTVMMGEGFYSEEKKNILFVVVTLKEVYALRQKVREIDPDAFIIIADVHEVLGHGFRPRINK
ncbi:MAG: YitT family protein [Candidatus Marinimicrobia bacterium]|nr:YitT family protein [Candidatus Neomarinimicrobiota bacterium]